MSIENGNKLRPMTATNLDPRTEMIVLAKRSRDLGIIYAIERYTTELELLLEKDNKSEEEKKRIEELKRELMLLEIAKTKKLTSKVIGGVDDSIARSNR